MYQARSGSVSRDSTIKSLQNLGAPISLEPEVVLLSL